MNNPQRTYNLKRSFTHGYGFVVGHEFPTIIKHIEAQSPSFGKLQPGDIVVSINGINVEERSREQIVKMVQLCDEQVDITVRQPSSYEELIRKTNLTHPRYFCMDQSSNVVSPDHMQQTLGHKLPQSKNMQQFSLSNQNSLNRVVTSISQHESELPKHLSLNSNNNFESRSLVSKSNFKSNYPNIDRNPFKFKNDIDNIKPKPFNAMSCGRHSPLPSRRKSLTEDDLNKEPQLRRCNTMRPVKSEYKAKTNQEIINMLSKLPVIRVFFENGQTKVLNYDQETTVATVLKNLNSKSGIKEISYRYFGLSLGATSDDDKLHKRNKLHILDETSAIFKIKQLPYASKIRLLYRIVRPPRDTYSLFNTDKIAFDYLYQQSCNDLRRERLKNDVDEDATFKLSSICLVEYVYSNYTKSKYSGKDAKHYLELVKNTPGIVYFVPRYLIESTKNKKSKEKFKHKIRAAIKKTIEEIELKMQDKDAKCQQENSASSSFHQFTINEPSLTTADCLKLLFLDFLSTLTCYGNVDIPVKSSSPFEENLVSDLYPSSLKLDEQDSIDISSSPSTEGRTSKLTTPLVDNNNSNLQSNSLITLDRNSQLNHVREYIAQTPSIESISSITFNSQNPSPMSQPKYYRKNIVRTTPSPSPLPRSQILNNSKLNDTESIDKLYSQRYSVRNHFIDEKIRSYILPPPPRMTTCFENSNITSIGRSMRQSTQILSDSDLDFLRVPPPPKAFL